MGNSERKKTMIMFGGLCVCVIGIVIYIVASTFSFSEDADEREGILIDVPDGIAHQIPESKKTAYQERKVVSAEEYFDMLSAEDEACAVAGREDEDISDCSHREQDDAVIRVFGEPEESLSSYDPVRNGVRLAVSMSEEERLAYDRRRAEMIRDVIAGGGPAEASTDKQDDEVPDAIDFTSMEHGDNIISYLDDEASGPLEYAYSERRPLRCMFIKDEKVSNGQRVIVRLLDEFSYNGIRIPANSHLAAICKISDRLELSVRSFEMNGRIVPLALDAYDTDGLEGIYCPETLSNKNVRRAKDDAITASGSAFGGLVSDIANTIIRTGANIARSASGEVAVNVASGYEFFLVQSEKNR